MKLAKYILSIIAIVISVSASGKTLRVPEAHAKATGAMSAQSTPLMAAAMESARLNSPFAAVKAEFLEKADETDALIEDMKNYAAGFLGTRYRLGSSSPSGFDCSGFTSYIFRNFGYDLNRDSRSQFKQGEKVDKDNLKPGDLLFFSSRSSGKGRVGHVAMVTEVNADGSCTFIHASTKNGVTYQKFPDGGYYSRHFLGAKRIVGVL
ncbi:MAG: NlpC/P60 family protein [Muribaculaceae bacterium]|nr:NlpC/P60 family protein [Muribaculaceae bacterium]